MPLAAMDPIEQLEAFLARPPDDAGDEIARTIASLQVEGRIPPPRQFAVSWERLFTRSEPIGTDDEMDRRDAEVGMPRGTLREAWTIARARRSKS